MAIVKRIENIFSIYSSLVPLLWFLSIDTHPCNFDNRRMALYKHLQHFEGCENAQMFMPILLPQTRRHPLADLSICAARCPQRNPGLGL
jgi:hypothetical protein